MSNKLRGAVIGVGYLGKFHAQKYKNNPNVELVGVCDHFPAQAGYISRAIFSRPDWRTSPRKVMVGRGYMKTGSFPSDDTHVVLLKLSSGRSAKHL